MTDTQIVVTAVAYCLWAAVTLWTAVLHDRKHPPRYSYDDRQHDVMRGSRR